MKLQKLILKNFVTHEDTTFDLTKFERRAFCFWGKTGSGKSSVLDGIHYALWGTPLNSKRRGKKDCLRNDTAPEKEDMSVTLEFTIEGQPYKIFRRMTPAGSSFVNMTLPDGEVIEKSKEVLPILEARLGLSEGQFDTICMLEQGGFAKFLHSSSTEREGILRDLFSTHAIEEFTTFSVNRAKELLAEVERQASTLTQLTGVQSVELDKWLEDARQTLATKTDWKNKLQTSHDKIVEELDTINKKLGELENQKKTADQLVKARADLEQFNRDYPIHQAAEDDQNAQRLKELIEQLETALKYVELLSQLDSNRIRLDELNLQLRGFTEHCEFPRLSELPELTAQLTALTDGVRVDEQELSRLTKAVEDSKKRDTARDSHDQLTQQQTALGNDIQTVTDRLATERDKKAEYDEAVRKQAELKQSQSKLNQELATFNNPEEQQRRLRELADNLERDFLKWLKEQNLYDWFHKAACGDPDAIASYFDDVSNPNRFNWFEHNSILSARGIDGTQDVVRYREILSELATIGEEIAKVNEIITSLSNVKETIAGLETHETKLRGFLGNCQRKIGEANATIKAFTDLYPTETTTDFEVQLSNWQSAVEAKRVELQTLSDLVGRLTQLLNGVNTLQPQVNQLKKVVEDQEKVIGGQTMDGEFYGMSPNDVSNKLANTRVELDLLETKIVQQEKRLEELKNTVAILENVAPKGNFEAEIATWVGKRDTKISERSEKSKEIAEINSTVVALRNTISRVETDIPKFSELREKQKTWKYTADMISGNNSKKISLESFVLNSRLSQIVDAANLFLQQFYPDRFELQASLENATKRSRAGLALVVYDLTKGTERFPETFSGGETFILSLALALGLSQTTQDVIANPLQDLFIDEGFGTLDSETLAYVATALQDLTTTGVSVGIITHVEALQQAVGVGFKLVKNNESKTEVSYL